jgi:release factor glutamine methyltransferase
VSTWTIASLLAVTAQYLQRKGSSSPRLDAELLLARTLGLARIDLYTQHDRPLVVSEVDAYRELVARRAAHEPVAYLLGAASFRYLELEVKPAVLIPRPETEELVQAALEWLETHPLLLAPGERTAPVVVDVGTGSGAIALSLAKEAGIAVLGLDRSEEALAVAERNCQRLGLASLVSFEQADLLTSVTAGGFRLVVSNPPYVSRPDIESLAPDVREFEPMEALDGGPDGLDVYRRLIPQAALALGPGGALLTEVGDGQAEAVESLACAAGFPLVRRRRDLSGKERILLATRPGTVICGLDEFDAGIAGTLSAALRAGAVLGVPTDTVYGLAAGWRSGDGVRALFDAKGRGEARPVAVLFSSVAAIRSAIPDLAPQAAKVLDALLPGPYTFVVGTTVLRPPLVGTADSLGVRVPDHPPLLRALEQLNVPLAATSANLSGRPDPRSLSEVDPCLLAHCAAALAPCETGTTSIGVASTVVDLRPLSAGEEACVLRAGAVSAADVLARIATIAAQA